MAAHDPRLKPPPGNVLVVDDVESNRDLLRRRLERQGFDVQIACDGRQALERIGQESFDLVLLDLMMPQMGGDQVLQAIRRQHSTIQLPVIMVTAKDQSQDVAKLLKLGANDYVTEPIDFDVLLARMGIHLSRRRAEQERQRLVKALEQAVRRDALTGLYNRHYLDEILGKELELAKRYGHALSLMVVDLDGFKRVNDELGHLKGDEVLRAFGRLLRQHLRQTDLAFRYGGDEFAVLMSSVVDQPSAAAQRLRKVFQESAAQLGVRGYPLGLSIGTVTWQPGMALDAQDMLRQADVHLYHDKSRQSISQLALEGGAGDSPALERAEWAEFQSLFLDSVGELIVATELDGTIFYANRAFRRWVDLPAHALLEKRLADAVPAFSALVGQAQAGDLSQEQVLWEAPGTEPRVLLVTPNRLETDRARLFAYVYVGADVTRLEQSNRRLFQTQKFLEKLNAQTALEDILQLLLEQAVHMVANADSGSALLLDERSGELEFVAAVGWDLQALKRITIKPELNIQHLKYRDEPAIIRDDLAQYQRQHFAPGTVDKLRSVGLPKSFLSVPIKVNGRVLGYFNLNHKLRSDAFTPQDLEAARSLEPHIALAVKRAREVKLLQEQQQRYRALFEHAPDGITLLDLQGNYVEINSQMLNLTGYSKEEALQLGFRQLIAPAEQVDSQRRLELLQQGIALLKPYRKHFMRKDGTPLLVELTVAPIPDERGQVQYILSLARDLSEVERLEQQLSESEQLYRTLVENTLVGVYVFRDDQVLYINKHLEEMTGYCLTELQQRGYLSIVHPQDRATVVQHVQKRMQGQEKMAHYGYRVMRKDGRLMHVEVFGTVVPYQGKTAVVGTALDVTHRKEAELREADLRRQLEKIAVQTATLLARIIDGRDPSTAGHCERMAQRAVQVGRRLKLPPQRLEALRLATLLHDIGKLGVPQELLCKVAPLTESEWVQVKDHVRIGVELVQSIHPLRDEAGIIAQHHERWDGSGYPQSLRGEVILLEARILAVVDAYDAMASDRPYRQALSPQAARAELQRGAGSQWDPRVVGVLLECLTAEP